MVAKARAGLGALDAHPTIAATLRRERRRRTQLKTKQLERAAPILYGKYAGRQNTDDVASEGASLKELAPAPAPAPAAEDVWREFADPEGYPYWYNEATGESTYDSPYARLTAF